MDHRIVFTDCTDPFHNLALEELLFEQQKTRNGVTLYLWQNQNTVVIGKTQNAWKECRISLLEQEEGRLARRSSGGGAVFHDLGNLNFTFLTDAGTYDVARQLKVIQMACASFGVETAFTGRNDLVLKESGAKFSGNAFKSADNTCLHHGTILIDVDMEKLSRYLAPSKEKLRAKGIESVRSRVTNLKDHNAAITIDTMKSALTEAFIKEYGPAMAFQEQDLASSALDALTERYASWDWRMGRSPQFDITLENRFDWGEVTFHLMLENGRIKDVQVYSDAMDEAFTEAIAPKLAGCPFSSQKMAEAFISLGGRQGVQLADWILEKAF